MGKNDVRAAAQSLVVLAEAEAEAEKLRAQGDFQLAAAAADSRHVLMPLFGGKSVKGSPFIFRSVRHTQGVL